MKVSEKTNADAAHVENKEIEIICKAELEEAIKRKNKYDDNLFKACSKS